MSLGLPSHLAHVASSRALASAAHAAGSVCLAAAFVCVIAVGTGSHGTAASAGTPGDQGGIYWLTLATLVPMAGLLAVLTHRRSLTATIAYLVVGTICTYLYVLTLLRNVPGYGTTDLFIIALLVIAMTLVGGAGVGALPGLGWTTAGFTLAEAAVCAAAVSAGRVYRPDVLSVSAFLLFASVFAYVGMVRGVRERPQSALHRAIRDDLVVRTRRQLAVSAAVDLHDTVLSDLVTVAQSMPGPLRIELRQGIERDLRDLGRDPADSQRRRDRQASAHETDLWSESELNAAIELARDEGLTVDVSGERGALAHLSAESRRAVGLAVRQCLVNVIRHAGTTTAEVAIVASDETVSVMVVDAGRGFDDSTVPSDRLGLRGSVRDRIEQVGGRVTVWTRPNSGTTVMLMVPREQPVGPGGAG